MTIIEVLVLLFVVVFLWRVVARQTRKLDRPANDAPKQNDDGAKVVPFDREHATVLPDKRLLSGYARIVDGDTIVIKKTQIRLFGVDAPEINHPYGQKAKWALVSLCKKNTVTAEILETDSHGRTVARCTLRDGRDLSAEMVKLGLAIDWTKFSGGEYLPLEVVGVRKKTLASRRAPKRTHACLG